jgi:large subunit ribosomal protein L6
MSRIGKMPIALPAKVEVKVAGNNVITVKGPKGELKEKVNPDIKVEMNNGQVEIVRPTDQKRHKALHGLYRALIANMVKGVSEGYTKEMELYGVGYRAANTGQVLELTIGYSHPIMFVIPSEIKLETKSEKGKQPTIILSGIDKQLIGQIAAKIRSFRSPEPYKGKGIRFTGEVIRRKAGKTSGKGGKGGAKKK